VTPARTATAPVTAPAARGVLQLAVSPWGSVDIDGAPAGIAPPLSRLDLPVGRHSVVIRNADFPPHTATVDVSADQPAVVKHRFGS
jgi:eukaryotic-like serine/threonine-protein kinase